MRGQVCYRDLQKVKECQDLAQKVIALVQSIRIQMPRIGTRKLYHMLRTELTALKVGRDKLFKILKANHMLIVPKRKYKITTNPHHRFKKHKDTIKNVELVRSNQMG